MHYWSLRLSSTIESVILVEPFVEEVAHTCNLDEEVYNNILLVLIEAVTNSITHGNCGDPSKCVQVDCMGNTQKLTFTVTDEGCGFDPDYLPDPTHPDYLERPNGRGVFLIKALAQQVIYAKNGKQLTVIFDMLT